ncbi:MAG: GMP/IMP nucleotidase [Gammaproteobacteria bacterium]|nr:GMP/IMP nucleotidase [Gammaproteobacteria bacterium]
MVRWEDIDTVLLDMDGTLLDLHFDNLFWNEYLPLKWGELHGLDFPAASAQLLPRFRSREGTLSWYCLDYWTRELGLDIFELKSGIEDLIRVRPGADEFLAYVQSLGKFIALVTNAHEKLLQHKLARTGIAGHFDAIVSAHSLGLSKEEAGFWPELQARFAFNPGRTLLIDDNAVVLRSARAFGIRWLLTIARPDSGRPPRESTEFPALDSFQPLMLPARAKQSSQAG